MRISVSGAATLDVALARRAIRAALRPYGLPRDVDVALAFVDDALMRALNRRHRGHDRTTDVLSFGQELAGAARGAGAVAALRREPDGSLHLGDVVISAAQARRQARGKRPLSEEVAFLAAHGALHLLGFDDETAAGHREMLRLGRDALRAAKRRPPVSASG